MSGYNKSPTPSPLEDARELRRRLQQNFQLLRHSPAEETAGKLDRIVAALEARNPSSEGVVERAELADELLAAMWASDTLEEPVTISRDTAEAIAAALSTPPVEQALPPNGIVALANRYESLSPSRRVAISVGDLRIAAMAVSRGWTARLASPPSIGDERLNLPPFEAGYRAALIDLAAGPDERLRKAMEPFAKEADRWEPKGGAVWRDDCPFPANSFSSLKIGDLRRAREALSPSSTPEVASDKPEGEALELAAAANAIAQAEAALTRARRSFPDKGTCCIRGVIEVELADLKRSRHHILAAHGAADAAATSREESPQ